MKLTPKNFLLLLTSAVAATLLIFYAREGRYQDDTTHRTANVASRILMSRNSQSDEGTMPVPDVVQESPTPFTRTSLKALLQKSTSRLQCKLKSRTMKDSPARAMMDADSAKRTGYILVASFREQQTKASDNLFGLQCWAKTLFVSVVEPYIRNSHFVLPMSADQTDLLRYRDIFDLDVWQLLTAQHKFAPLVSWNDFLSKAPREIIVVHFKYLTAKLFKKRRSSNESMTHLAVSGSYKEGCDINAEFSRKIQYLRKEHNFTVIREVCFNFAQGDELTLFQFNRHLYSGLGPKTVTVFMEEWRGLGSMENGKRVILFDACLPSKYVQSVTYTWPSQQLICDAKKYRQKYLKTANYISLMVRTEKIVSLNSSHEYMAGCLNETLKAWKGLVASSGIQKTFLSMDIGSYGSNSLVEQNGNTKYYPFLDLYKAFIQELFGPLATIATWEAGFEEVALKHDLGYIGSLQKTLSAQSRCTVLTGGGTFQRHAQYIYERINRGKRKPCLKILHRCSRGLV